MSILGLCSGSLWSGFTLCNLAPQREVSFGSAVAAPSGKGRESDAWLAVAGEKRTEQGGKVANTTPLLSVLREYPTSPLFSCLRRFSLGNKLRIRAGIPEAARPVDSALETSGALNYASPGSRAYTPFPNASPIWRSRPRREAGRRVVDCAPHAPPYFSPHTGPPHLFFFLSRYVLPSARRRLADTASGKEQEKRIVHAGRWAAKTSRRRKQRGFYIS